MSPTRILSLQVGKPVTHPPAAPGEREWRSAIVKHPVSGPVTLGALGLEGDDQYDKRHHGGPDRAINVYPAEHYAYWRETPGLEGMAGGAFGENFTTEGLLETDTCIGDLFQVGEPGVGPVIAVSQPRGPCGKLNRRWNSPDLMERSSQSARIGWYARMVQPGTVRPGDRLTLLERPNPDWPIARVWALMRDAADPAELRALVDVKELADDWREAVQKIIEKG